MFKLWIIDTADKTHKYSDLFGQFAISFYASVDNAIRIKKMMGSNFPDAILLSEISRVDLVKEKFPSSLIVHIGENKGLEDSVLSLDDLCSTHSGLIYKAIEDFKEEQNLYSVCLDKLILKVDSQDMELKLSHKEALIMKSLQEAQDEAVCRESLSKILWGDLKVGERTLDSHISRLRKRLRPLGLNIESAYGSGYKICLEC